jgi:predicted S18 family serine protease
MATGTIDLDGYVGLIGGVKAKVLCAGRVGGSKVFMLPELNLPDAQKHVQDRKLKLKLCPLISMSDAINGAVRKPKLRASLDTVVAEGAGAAALRHNLVTVKAIANEDSAFSIIAAVIPGSGKVSHMLAYHIPGGHLYYVS